MTDLAETIFAEHSGEAILRGGEYWFTPIAAIEVLQKARLKSLTLLGFDAAELSDSVTQLSQADSWDYSAQSGRVPDPYEHAIQSLKTKSKTDLRFSIVLSEKR